MTSTETSSRQPIGYWLKRVDQLLTQRMDQVLKDTGLTRSHWQVLNLVHENAPTNPTDLWIAMKSFVDKGELDDIINDLARRDWLLQRHRREAGASVVEMTKDGRLAHANV